MNSRTRLNVRSTRMSSQLIRGFVVPLLLVGACWPTAGFLLDSWSVANWLTLNSVLLIGVAIIEMASIWVLLWTSLALMSMFTALPHRLRQRLANVTLRHGPSSARHIAHRVASGALAAAALVGANGGALADRADSLPDLLWDSEQSAELATESSPVAVVALPGESPLMLSVIPSPEGSRDDDLISMPAMPLSKAQETDSSSEAIRPTAEQGTVPDQETEPTPPSGSSRPLDSRKTTKPRALPTPEKSTDTAPSANSGTGTSSRPAIDREVSPSSSGAPNSVSQTDQANQTSRVDQHLVLEGDCLWNIASLYLESESDNRSIDTAWRSIYAANLDVIGPNPDLIEPGQLLTVPTELNQLHQAP